MKRLALTVSFLLAAVFPIANVSAASTDDFFFESFDAEYYLEKGWAGSTLKVRETFVAYFPNPVTNHGIDRCIPRKYKGQYVLVEPINGIPVYVDGGDKQFRSAAFNSNESYTTFDSGDNVCLRIGNANEYVFGWHTYLLEYEYQGVIIAPEDSGLEELYWNTNGTGWKQPFHHLSATVTFEDELIPELVNQPSCYVGRGGEKGSDRCQMTRLENGVRFEASNLSAHENLTFDFQFKRGTFPEEGIIELKFNYLYWYLIPIALAILSIFIIIRLVKYSKTKSIREIISGPCPPQYLPPRLNIASSTRLYYYHKDMKSRDFVATLIGAVVDKKIHLLHPNNDSSRLAFQVIVGRENDISQAEYKALEILNNGDTPFNRYSAVAHGVEQKAHTPVEILKARKSRAQKSTIKHDVKSFRKEAVQKLYHDGCFNSQTDTKKPRLYFRNILQYIGAILIAPLLFFCTSVGIILIFVVGIIYAIFWETINEFLANLFDPAAIYAGKTASLIIIAILVFLTVLICRSLKRRTEELSILTEKGAREIVYLKGLKEYMSLAEADRLKFLQSVKGADVSPEGIIKLYERLLPYAVVFDVEESWFGEMKKYYTEAELDDDVLKTLDLSSLNYVSSYTSSISNFAIASISSAAVSSSISHFADSLGGFSGGGGGSSSGSGGGGGGSSGGGGGGGGGGGW